ncbi:hypothetical protein [Prochlorococcus sp. MIT 1306]|uniref:hypothetical protein n=1 Tax=Prochlorococcus sp. MIT 1306 TaxID=1799667 RepID=UPI0039B3B111
MSFAGRTDEFDNNSRTYHQIAYCCALTKKEAKLISILKKIIDKDLFEKYTSLICSKILPRPWNSVYIEIFTKGHSSTIGNDLERKIIMLPDNSSKSILKFDWHYKKKQNNPSWPKNYEDTGNALVVCWEGASNAMGRAYVMANGLDAIGRIPTLLSPIRVSTEMSIWEPILERERIFSMKLLPYYSDQDFIDTCIDFIRKNKYEYVWVSKVRPQSVLIGYLYKQIWNSKVVVDIDDYEAAFHGEVFNMEEWSKTTNNILEELESITGQNIAGIDWLRFAEYIASLMDGYSFANKKISECYNNKGHVIRHMRNTTKKIETDSEGTTLKKRMEEECIRILFNGTIRPHKGIENFIIELKKERSIGRKIELIIYRQKNIETIETILQNCKHMNLTILENIKMSENTQICKEVDIICTLQEVDSLISIYQTPAKISDAAIAGSILLATKTEPILELSRLGVDIIFMEDYKNIKDAIFACLSKKKHKTKNGKIEIFDYKENMVTLEKLFSKKKEGPYIDKKKDYAKINKWFNVNYSVDLDIPVLAIKKERLILKKPFVISMFWRQSDTGTFPRRHHAIAKRIAQRKEVKHLFHWEPPVSIQTLESNNEKKQHALNRYRGKEDSGKITYSTYIYTRNRLGTEFKNDYGELSKFGSFVNEKIIGKCGSQYDIAWVYPPFPNIGMLIEQFNGKVIISDYVDNVLEEELNPAQRKYILSQYQYFAKESELCFVNCKPMKRLIESYGAKDVRLVPNAFPLRNFKGLEKYRLNPKKINLIYTGNMNKRIDWSIIRSICSKRPEWEVHLYGDSYINTNYYSNGRNNMNVHENINAAELPGLFSEGAIAFIPHLDNNKTKYMNLIKYYEYRSLGIPVVTTSSFNMPDLDHIYYASDANGIISAIEKIISFNESNESFYPPEDFYENHSWSTRVSSMMNAIEEKVFRI